MLNEFYHDRITHCLSVVEEAIEKLNFADAKKVMEAIGEIRVVVNSARELSAHADHIWGEYSHVLGDGWQNRSSGINPQTGQPYSYVDDWAVRFELVRREILFNLRNGSKIVMT